MVSPDAQDPDHTAPSALYKPRTHAVSSGHLHLVHRLRPDCLHCLQRAGTAPLDWADYSARCYVLLTDVAFESAAMGNGSMAAGSAELHILHSPP